MYVFARGDSVVVCGQGDIAQVIWVIWDETTCWVAEIP